jgi:hypothetical protein
MAYTAREIRDAGLERGWNAAAYAEAYGGNPMEGVGEHCYSNADGFADAFREGIEQYENDNE